MYHVKIKCKRLTDSHLRALLSGVTAQVEGLGECPAQLPSHCLLSATTLGRGHCPAALSWRQAGLLQRWNWLRHSLWFHGAQATPGLPGWVRALKPEAVLPPSPSASPATALLHMGASHCVTAAPLCPCVRGPSVETPKQGVKPTCPGSCTRLWDKLLTWEGGRSQLVRACWNCGLQFTFRSLCSWSWGRLGAQGNGPSPPPVMEASAPTASTTGSSAATPYLDSIFPSERHVGRLTRDYVSNCQIL